MTEAMITGITTSCLAIFGGIILLVISKWEERRRAETALLRDKLEEYFKSLNSIIVSLRIPPVNNDMSDQEYSRIYHDTVHQVGVLSELSSMYAKMYFSATIPRFEEFKKSISVIEQWMIKSSYPVKIPDTNKHKKLMGDVREKLNCLQSFMISNKSELTKEIFTFN